VVIQYKTYTPTSFRIRKWCREGRRIENEQEEEHIEEVEICVEIHCASWEYQRVV